MKNFHCSDSVFSPTCHVFEVVQKLPKFASYFKSPITLEDPKSYVTFNISDRVNRVLMWLNQNFVIERALDGVLEETFTSQRDGKILKISMKSDGKVTFI